MFKNLRIRLFFVLTCLPVLFISCSKSDTGGGSGGGTIPAKSREANLLSFDFRMSSNTGLTSDITGIINEANKTVTVNVPPFTQVTNLVASFTASAKATVQIAGNVQVNSTTPNNFTTPLIYSVIAEDGTQKTYTVTVIDAVSLVKSITLESNTKLIIADGISKPTLTVKFLDANGNTLPNINYQLLSNNAIVQTNNFTTTQQGSYVLSAKINNVESNKITIQARDNIQYTIITIPVIFHLVHFGEAVGAGTNFTATQINDVLKELNNAYSNLIGSTDPNAVDTKIRFRLAIYGINNNNLIEPGLDRFNATSYDIGSAVSSDDIANDKKLGPSEEIAVMKNSVWNPYQYLNIWLLPRQPLFNHASYPLVYSSNPLAGLTSVAVNYIPGATLFPQCVVSVNNGLLTAALTIAHETGHMFGLFHPFSIDGCVTSDYCPDTYSYRINFTDMQCADNNGNLIRNNIMDYGGIGVGLLNTFTYDQRIRIRHVFNYGVWYKDLKNSTK